MMTEDISLSEVCEDRLAAAEWQNNILSFIPALRIPCADSTVDSDAIEGQDALFAAKQFLNDPEGRLLAVLGQNGIGKSRLLHRLAESVGRRDGLVPLLMTYAEVAASFSGQRLEEVARKVLAGTSRKAAKEFAELATSQPTRMVILLDACDNPVYPRLTGAKDHFNRRLVPLFEGQVKLVVAGRPSLAANAGTVAEESRADPWRWQSPTRAMRILELRDCRLDTVNQALNEMGGQHTQRVRQYLNGDKVSAPSRVRRPLYLNMLLDAPDLATHVGAFSIWRLYDAYVESVLSDSKRYPANCAAVSVSLKRRVLGRLAFEVFRSPILCAPPTLSIDLALGAAGEESAQVERKPPGEAPRQEDLLSLLAPLVTLNSRSGRADSRMCFTHESFFEFFLSEYFATELYRDHRFGLNESANSLYVLNSLVPYFLRSKFGLTKSNAVLEMLRRDPAFMDRLLGFFFLEDEPEATDLLRSSSSDYRKFLDHAAHIFETELMRKVARFQRVLLDSGIQRGLRYVNDVRSSEADPDQDMEVHTFADNLSPTDLLLGRLENPRFYQALPITVYRLGLFGEMRAAHFLTTLLKSTHDSALRSLIHEAIERIRSRSK